VPPGPDFTFRQLLEPCGNLVRRLNSDGEKRSVRAR
jgi:hypothetical protein